MKDYLSDLGNKWKQFVPGTPFDYSFLDSEFDSLYRSEQLMGTVFGIFTFLSIFVACLGLFGLSLYTVERAYKRNWRTKSSGCFSTKYRCPLIPRFVKNDFDIGRRCISGSLDRHGQMAGGFVAYRTDLFAGGYF